LPRERLDILFRNVNKQPTRTRMLMNTLHFLLVNRVRGSSTLDKPLDDVSKLSDFKFNFTPHGRRRTYQDLARAGGSHGAATRAISDHAMQATQLHYSMVRGGEVKDTLAKVAKVATADTTVVDVATAGRKRT
jgi:hypothetical protein